eukprot:TRINITY_DN2683_c0_g1_i8.p1 TRINITY_DN2683_c0_g1~~TRINITY_DN2683_c0_g1_i8.p1  ORF type:complete len:290 (+),score=-37.79 TRINITY_DN2683_c0_g1_i8:154-1023(+)
MLQAKYSTPQKIINIIRKLTVSPKASNEKCYKISLIILLDQVPQQYFLLYLHYPKKKTTLYVTIILTKKVIGRLKFKKLEVYVFPHQVSMIFIIFQINTNKIHRQRLNQLIITHYQILNYEPVFAQNRHHQIIKPCIGNIFTRRYLQKNIIQIQKVKLSCQQSNYVMIPVLSENRFIIEYLIVCNNQLVESLSVYFISINLKDDKNHRYLVREYIHFQFFKFESAYYFFSQYDCNIECCLFFGVMQVQKEILLRNLIKQNNQTYFVTFFIASFRGHCQFSDYIYNFLRG